MASSVAFAGCTGFRLFGMVLLPDVFYRMLVFSLPVSSVAFIGRTGGFGFGACLFLAIFLLHASLPPWSPSLVALSLARFSRRLLGWVAAVAFAGCTAAVHGSHLSIFWSSSVAFTGCTGVLLLGWFYCLSVSVGWGLFSLFRSF